MTKKFKKGIKDLVAEAEAAIETISLEDAIAQHGSDKLMFVDVRDVRELERDGMIPGAYHVPRGMAEFWFDPDSPYFKEDLGDDNKTYVLYCAAAWRSALTAKTLKDMGMENVKQFAEGFKAWKEAGGPVGERPKKD
ncbi:MAG: rhodanese-like domain-containing protein [Rhodospirillales bacterium]|nr:rhodanese-like domain-containing protein [Rhodospirillales bacterium]